jgi:hypothetical protein
MFELRKEHLRHRGAGHATQQQPHRAEPGIQHHSSMTDYLGDTTMGVHDFDPEAIELLEIGAATAHEDVARRPTYHALPSHMLRSFSHNHPFVPVYPPAYEATSIRFTQAGNQDLTLRDNAIACMLICTPGAVIYANWSGVASYAAAPVFDPNTIVDPTGFLMFCYGRHQLSIGADQACTVSLFQFIQDALAGSHP